MTEIDNEKVLAFLKNKWTNPRCPMCGGGGWNVEQGVFELRKFHGGNFIMGGPLIPIIPVSCQNCGNTVFVNAIMAGVVDRDQPSENKTKTKEEVGNE
jgi:ribosomal protein S27AE